MTREEQEKTTFALPLKAAADAVGLSHWTLRKMIAQGRLAVVRINRKILVEPDTLRQLVKQHRTPGR